MPASTFGGIELGKSSLYAHQQALNITGHNIANANNENYSRQQVIMGALDPMVPPSIHREVTAGMMGTGVQVTSIARMRDAFIDARVSNESATLGRWEKEESLTHQIELIYNEPSDNSLRSALDAFWTALEDLSNNPESQAVRAMVRERGEALSGTLQHMYAQLQALGGAGGTGGGQNAIDAELAAQVANINGWARDIAALNVAIKNAEAAGDNPNDLYDRRDALVKSINEQVDVVVTNNDPDEYRVSIGGLVLAQGAIAHELQLQRDPLDDKQYVYWEGREKLQINNGGMAALLNVRDEVLPYHFDRLNEFAAVFTETFNELHRHGFGLDGKTGRDFFAPLATETTGVYKLTGNPQAMPPTGTYLMQAEVPLDGDGSTAAVENYEGNPIGTGRLVINGFSIDYDGGIDSLSEVVERINLAGAGVVAGIDPTGRLTLTATAAAGYAITSLDDTGNLLDRLGILRAGQTYDGTSAGEAALAAGVTMLRPPAADAAMRFRVSDEVRLDLDVIAAAAGDDTDLDGIPDQSKGPGNSDMALDLAQLKTAKVLSEGTASFNDFYNALLAKLGTDAQTAKAAAGNQKKLVENLKELQSAVSGVSLDEEMTNLIKFQRGFEAASRFINIYDSMLDRIINGLKTS